MIERKARLKVLIVDDSAMSRKLVMKALPDELKAEVTQAANGQEALDAYHAGHAEVIFLDLTMPVMDGFSTLELLKREDANAVVIVISADIQPQAQQRVRELGAAAFVKKPITPEAMQVALRQIGLI
ncbi:response regulator [Pseudomonas sp. LPB0260]|jgi:two-component system, chemotaxis family, chemotaxis protein CheY|nr:response regulator [Pseudomonas sp. LPB0260]QLC77248.1 response regulator [Pseudomonas sp. LPB0260]